MESFREDVAFLELKKRTFEINSYSDPINEANTRLKIIDVIIFDVLLWKKSSVDVEKYCRAEGYADYVFYINKKPVLVLEAKKSGATFALPVRKFENRPYLFGILASESKSAAAALQQAIGYAATLGARYVAISNGLQWFFTVTFVPDQDLDQRLVYVFESFDAICSRFSKFCNCFSEAGLMLNAVCSELNDNLKQPAPAKPSSRIHGYPAPASRNIFQNELSYILDYVWQVMSQDEGTIQFVEHCYVSPDTHGDVMSLVRNLLEKRKKEDEILRSVEVCTIDKLPHKMAHLPSERPFVVLGEIGRGKSSFLKYLRFVAAKESLSNYIQIELNFLDRPDNAIDIPLFIYEEIYRQLHENYEINIYDNNFVRGVLNLEIKNLTNTLEGKYYEEDDRLYKEFELKKIQEWVSDKHTYLAKVFHHLKRGRLKSIALFLDNLDRRHTDLQETAFLKASAMARDWASMVFICLRPETFYRSQQAGVMDTIAPITFTVGQPDISLVLKRRFAYAKAIAEGSQFESTPSFRAVPGREICLDLPRVAKIFESCEFAARKKYGIIPVLEAVSNGNIRQLLELARRIISSGHLDTKKIIGKIEESGSYAIPDFEGIKTLLFGDYMHFDAEKSQFINLFDIRHADPSEHFVRLSVLSYLSKIPIDADYYLGYIDESTIYDYLSSLGYSRSVSEYTIRYLAEKNCIRYFMMNGEKTRYDNRVRITPLGRFHLFSLIHTFQYLDAIIIDTPILDAISWDIFSDSDIIKRLLRTEKFLFYLDSKSIYIQDPVLNSEWKEIIETAKKNIKEIRDRI
ncbi:hypothetical protein H4684_003983 [Desulfomicrobium macestii]|uniref:Uncharacterized protein n=1 Tax=Desulfomicrobium macestii TaxID=90731 RepID=A0ABR9H983_9BACT|nr:hypothetical protein [Desulfomicrobium macestii]MBE1427291.1 hypothetical protein [Desulfomicrobium macestii]